MSSVASPRLPAIPPVPRAARRLFPLVLFLPACLTPRYIDSQPFTQQRDQVMLGTITVLERQGFRVTGLTEGREIEAKKTLLSPFNREGKRWSASVRLDAVPEGTVVRLMVRVETNSNITNPMDEHQADWGSEQFDTEMESLMLSLIDLKMNPPKLPPMEQRDRRGRR
jgi:hypothetical protein